MKVLAKKEVEETQQKRYALDPFMKIPKPASASTLARLVKKTEEPNADGNFVRFSKKAQIKDDSRAAAESSVSCGVQQAAVMTAAFTLEDGKMLPASRKICLDFTHVTFNKQQQQTGGRQVALHNRYPANLPLSTKGKLQVPRSYPVALYFTSNGAKVFSPFIVFTHSSVSDPFLLPVPGLNHTNDMNKNGHIFFARKEGTMLKRFYTLFDVMIPEITDYVDSDIANSPVRTTCLMLDGQWEQLQAASKQLDGASSSSSSQDGGNAEGNEEDGVEDTEEADDDHAVSAVKASVEVSLLQSVVTA